MTARERAGGPTAGQPSAAARAPTAVDRIAGVDEPRQQLVHPRERHACARQRLGSPPVGQHDLQLPRHLSEPVRLLGERRVLDRRDAEPIGGAPAPHRAPQGATDPRSQGSWIGLDRDQRALALDGLERLDRGGREQLGPGGPEQPRQRTPQVAVGLARTAVGTQRHGLGGQIPAPALLPGAPPPGDPGRHRGLPIRARRDGAGGSTEAWTERTGVPVGHSTLLSAP